MKPIFGVNIDDRNNKKDNSDRFIAENADEALSAELESIADTVIEERQRKMQSILSARGNARSKKNLDRTFGLCAIICLISTVMFLFAGANDAIESEDRLVTFAPIVYLAIYGVYMLVTRVILKKKAPVESAQETDASDEDPDLLDIFDIDGDPRVSEASDRIYRSLGVPDGAPTVDILMFDYKTEGGEILLKKKGKRVRFFNYEMRLFKTERALCIADVERRYEFPLDGIRGHLTVRGEFALGLWNKETPCDRGEYRLFGMTEDRDGDVLFGSYHILEIECDGEVWGLYLPCYELSALRELGVVAN